MRITDQVFYSHQRSYDYDNHEGVIINYHVSPHGGATVAFKLVPFLKDRVGIDVGWAICSVKDNFCRKTGRELAKQRMETKKNTLVVDTSFVEQASVQQMVNFIWAKVNGAV